jgi:hypothetical protein
VTRLEKAGNTELKGEASNNENSSASVPAASLILGTLKTDFAQQNYVAIKTNGDP